jgi:hypothetical protein
VEEGGWAMDVAVCFCFLPGACVKVSSVIIGLGLAAGESSSAVVLSTEYSGKKKSKVEQFAVHVVYGNTLC